MKPLCFSYLFLSRWTSIKKWLAFFFSFFFRHLLSDTKMNRSVYTATIFFVTLCVLRCIFFCWLWVNCNFNLKRNIIDSKKKSEINRWKYLVVLCSYYRSLSTPSNLKTQLIDISFQWHIPSERKIGAPFFFVRFVNVIVIVYVFVRLSIAAPFCYYFNI